MSETISTPEILATLAVLSRDASYDATFAAGGKPDAIGTQNDAVWRAQAERLLLTREKDGVPDAAWRREKRLELLTRGDKLVAERVQEKLKAYWADYKARTIEKQKLTFKWTENEKLSIEENRKRREKAHQEHMASSFAFAMAQREVQKDIENGAFSPVPSQTVLEAESRAEVERERPWLFAHLAAASDGGTAARTPSEPVHEVARRVLAGTTSHSAAARSAIDNPATVHKRDEKSKAELVDEITALTNELNKLVVALLEAYAKRGVEIAGSPRETQRQRAMTLARACLGFDPGEKRERFLAAIMRASGL